ncbi:hypothetical protein Bca4012_028215 [Brassica carinata]
MKLHKPNPRRGDKSKSWSELPEDLINSVLERLDFADSRRAESVCSSWYSAAKRCVAKKQIPWLILLPDEDDKINNHWCKLFNPGEKDKLYKIRDEDVEFANSYCLATYAYSKKGDTFWNQIQIPVVYGCSHMVYKDQKIYYLLNDYIGSNGFIKIFDFSGEIPRETFQCGPGNISSLDPTGNSWRITNAKLVVTVTGDVLYVENWAALFTSLWSFRLYKVYSSGLFNKYEQVDSLGNEAMLFDLGITVLPNDDIVGGFKRNSIYYKTTCHEKNTTQICLFNFETKEMEPLHKFDCSSQEQLARSLWFLPSFKQT